MVGCGKKVSQNAVCGDLSFSNKIMLCNECLKAQKPTLTPLNPIYKGETDFKGLNTLHKKRLEDLPLVVCCIGKDKATYRLCRFFSNGYYCKYVCFGLTASASRQGTGESLKV